MSDKTTADLYEEQSIVEELQKKDIIKNDIYNEDGTYRLGPDVRTTINYLQIRTSYGTEAEVPSYVKDICEIKKMPDQSIWIYIKRHGRTSLLIQGLILIFISLILLFYYYNNSEIIIAFMKWQIMH